MHSLASSMPRGQVIDATAAARRQVGKRRDSYPLVRVMVEVMTDPSGMAIDSETDEQTEITFVQV